MTIVAVLIGAFISGSVIVESLFSIPGIGVFFLNSVRNRDYAVVQAAVLISATVFVVANMAADMLYAVLDPRVGSSAAARGQKLKPRLPFRGDVLSRAALIVLVAMVLASLAAARRPLARPPSDRRTTLVPHRRVSGGSAPTTSADQSCHVSSRASEPRC